MIPTRQKLIGDNKVEEWQLNFFDDVSVYINGKKVDETYDQAVKRLEEEE